MRVGVVTGLKSELACLEVLPANVRPAARASGARAPAAAAAAAALIRDGCGALVSFGLAGGLQPSLAAGDLILADRVIDADGLVLYPDGAWRAGLLQHLSGGGLPLFSGCLAGSDVAVAAVEAKTALAAATGAIAVDMESHSVARVARAHGIPFIIVRAIADPSDHAVPAWLTGVIDAGGRTRLAAVAKGLLRHPADWARLVTLGREAGRGLAALRRFALDAGPLFGIDLGR